MIINEEKWKIDKFIDSLTENFVRHKTKTVRFQNSTHFPSMRCYHLLIVLVWLVKTRGDVMGMRGRVEESWYPWYPGY